MPNIAAPEWPQMVTWVLVIIGWLIINRQHNARETRKERRAAVDRLNAELEELEKLAVEFHTANEFNSYALAVLTRRLGRLMRLVELTGMFNDSSKEVQKKVARVRMSITLSNADKSKFEQQHPGGPLLNQVANAINDLRFFVEDEFIRRHQR